MSLLRDNPNITYLVFDVETEGLSLVGKNRPFQLGYILYQNGKILEQKDRLIRWNDFRISEGAAKVTRFDEEKYKREALDPGEVLDEFENYLNNEKYIPVTHNGTNFDCFIIKNWREALGRKNDYSYLDRSIDTNALARAIKKGVKKIDRKDWKLMMFRFGNYVEKGLKTNLTSLGKELGIEVDYTSLHSALNDVILTAKILDKLKWVIEI